MASPVSVLVVLELSVDEADNKADPAVSTDKGGDNAEAGSGFTTVVSAATRETRERNCNAAKTLIFRFEDDFETKNMEKREVGKGRY
jgi:hypothetical protein